MCYVFYYPEIFCSRAFRREILCFNFINRLREGSENTGNMSQDHSNIVPEISLLPPPSAEAINFIVTRMIVSCKERCPTNTMAHIYPQMSRKRYISLENWRNSASN
jgi:hypothetical protein